MKKIFLLGTLLLLLPVTTVKALYCSYTDLANLKKIASNINASYDYVENNNEVIFSITLVNMPDTMYAMDTKTHAIYRGNEIVIPNYQSGQTVIFDIYTTAIDCEQEILYTIRVNLPTYNPYYKDNLCTTVSDYYLCQKWSSHGLSYDKFKEKMESYLHTQKPEPPKEEEPILNDNWWSKVLKIIFDYYYIPLALIIIGSGVGIYVINKRSNTYN